MNKDKIYIHHHLGFGDHIICNGLVREGSDGVDRINYDFVNDNLKKIFVEKSETIFDYIKLIEK